MKVVKIALWVILAFGVLITWIDTAGGFSIISFAAAILFGLAINQMLTNIRAIKENTDEMLKIAKKEADKQ